jgi:hypothetical protein
MELLKQAGLMPRQKERCYRQKGRLAKTLKKLRRKK